jgi:hypothetical protein
LKSRLGHQIHLVHKGRTLLDDPAAIDKLLGSIVAVEQDFTASVKQPWSRQGFGPLHFDGGTDEIGLLELVLPKIPKRRKKKGKEEINPRERERLESQKQEARNWEHVLFQECHGQIERDFFGYVNLYKDYYKAMPRLRARAKERLTLALQRNAKDIEERKTALEEQVAAMKKSGKATGLREFLKRYPTLVAPFRKNALLDSKVSLAEKTAILTHAKSLFSRRLNAMKEPLFLLRQNALQARRENPLLDDPVELERFLRDNSQDSILAPKEGGFWYMLRYFHACSR